MNCAFVNANRQFSSSLCLGVSRNITSESEFDTHFLSLPSVFLLGGQNIHQAYSVLLPWVCVCRGNSVCFVLACDFFFFLFSVAGLPCSAVWDFAQLEAAALHRGRVQRTCQGHTFLSFVSTPYLQHLHLILLIFHSVFCTGVFFSAHYSRRLVVSRCSASFFAECAHFQSCNNTCWKSVHAIEYLSVCYDSCSSTWRARWEVPVTFCLLHRAWKRKVWKRTR